MRLNGTGKLTASRSQFEKSTFLAVTGVSPTPNMTASYLGLR
jgi:hypothetical protein